MPRPRPLPCRVAAPAVLDNPTTRLSRAHRRPDARDRRVPRDPRRLTSPPLPHTPQRGVLALRNAATALREYRAASPVTTCQPRAAHEDPEPAENHHNSQTCHNHRWAGSVVRPSEPNQRASVKPRPVHSSHSQAPRHGGFRPRRPACGGCARSCQPRRHHRRGCGSGSRCQSRSRPCGEGP